jgi:hypothetical protein
VGGFGRSAVKCCCNAGLLDLSQDRDPFHLRRGLFRGLCRDRRFRVTLPPAK